MEPADKSIDLAARLGQAAYHKWKDRLVKPGSVKPWLRALIFGWDKSGKSYLLAGYPSPCLWLDYKERGLALYMRPDQGDVGIVADSPKTVDEFFTDMAPALMRGEFASCLLDSASLWWSFEIAGKRLSADVVNISTSCSSVTKGRHSRIREKTCRP